jgi:hypothetical protein
MRASNLVMPLKNMLIPVSVPITQVALDRHASQIKMARIRVTIPSMTTDGALNRAELKP